MSKTVSGKHGPLRTPMQGYMVHGDNSKLNPSTGANTTIPGTAPKAVPIQSPIKTGVVKGTRTIANSRD